MLSRIADFTSTALIELANILEKGAFTPWETALSKRSTTPIFSSSPVKTRSEASCGAIFIWQIFAGKNSAQQTHLRPRVIEKCLRSIIAG